MGTEAKHRLIIHGARGSHPVSGERFARYGGNTSCFSVETDTGLLIIDGGTGIASLGYELARRATLPPMTILLTHLHLDHLIGLPTFRPFLRKDTKVTIMTDPTQARNWRLAVEAIMDRPFWPSGILERGANIQFEDLPVPTGSSKIGGPITLHGVEVSWCPLSHPQGCVGYRLRLPDQSVAVGTDREYGDRQLDALFDQFCRGADVLIHDAQYTPDEFPARAGWGHSTWESGAKVAKAAGVKQLILTSHDPERSDDDVDRIVERARGIFPETVAATEQMVVEAGGPPRPAAGRPDGTPGARRAEVAARARGSDETPLTFRYAFRLDNGTEKLFTVNLDRKTLQLIEPPRTSFPSWTALPHCKCTNCPLRADTSPECPAATSLIDVVEQFGRSLSIETVSVKIETEARTYEKRAPLPEAVSSLIGILMVTSGCPVMSKLRPMVRHHLPFATLDETRYRILSMYLLAQFFAEKAGQPPDWDLKKLGELYEEIRYVNQEFFKRLSEMQVEDASLNAIVRLDTFADSITFMVDQQILDDLEQLFRPYL